MTKAKRRAAELVSKAYGYSAPYPSAAVQDRYARWFNEYDLKKKALLKVPKPYASWQHIADFGKALDKIQAGN